MKLTVTICPPSLSVTIKAPTMGTGFGYPVARYNTERDPYTGDYEVTPSRETTVLLTDGFRMTGNVTVHPIPSNWGQIEYDGAIMTIW